jgi:hypothetical protein
MRAASPAFYAESYKTVERSELFYNCFFLDEELEGDEAVVP